MTEYEQIVSTECEDKYIRRTPYEYRKKMGQFFTPIHVADFMSPWVINNKSGKTILDPAVGLGIFFRSILKSHPEDAHSYKFIGCDVCDKIIEEAKKLLIGVNEINIQLMNEDYLISDWDKQYDGIICNPPYLKFHNYGNQKELLELFSEKMNTKLSGFTNIYTLFLLKALKQVKTHGRVAFIVPSEFLNSNYGKKIKRLIKESGMLRFIIIIDFNSMVFDNATTTSCILLFAKDDYNHEVEFINIKDIDELNLIHSYMLSYPLMRKKGKVIKIRELDEAQKWRVYYQELNGSKYKNLVPFSSFARVSRGIATGANKYFLFSESKRRKHGISKDFLLPCLSKAQYARKHFFGSDDFERLRKADKPIYLLDAKDMNDTNLRKYIQMGEKQGIDRKYLTSHRTPWYSLENRPPAPILAIVFNRSGLRFVRNEANVYNLTSFHCVYPRVSLFLKLELLMAYLITDVAAEIFDDSRREYGDGLRKFEPNDLNDALVVDFQKITPDLETEILALYDQFRSLELKGKDTSEIKNALNDCFLKVFKR
ncbi:SAM-dependent DNA methyltransferase [bacterium]|nr:MAG: SAM-dependent DNA methyltransferase [bacterium]